MPGKARSLGTSWRWSSARKHEVLGTGGGEGNEDKREEKGEERGGRGCEKRHNRICLNARGGEDKFEWTQQGRKGGDRLSKEDGTARVKAEVIQTVARHRRKVRSSPGPKRRRGEGRRGKQRSKGTRPLRGKDPHPGPAPKPAHKCVRCHGRWPGKS